MPEKEALILASFSRYNGTGLVYMACITAILMLTALQDRDSLPVPLLRLGSAISSLCALVILTLLFLPGEGSIFGIVKNRDQSYPVQRWQLAEINRRYGLPDGGHYLAVFYHDESQHLLKGWRSFYNIKYEFETSNINFIAFNEEVHPDQYIIGTRGQTETTDRPAKYLAETIDTCDALIILDYDPKLQAQFDAFLEDYKGETPVYRAYELSPA